MVFHPTYNGPDLGSVIYFPASKPRTYLLMGLLIPVFIRQEMLEDWWQKTFEQGGVRSRGGRGIVLLKVTADGYTARL